MAQTIEKKGSPATLVAIIVAARRSGDRDLERIMRQTLQDEHDVTLTFRRRDTHQPQTEATR
jgi:hypothetical protein